MSLGATGKLNKATYGLVQAGRCWKTKLSVGLRGMWFEKSQADPCVFIRIGDDGEADIL